MRATSIVLLVVGSSFLIVDGVYVTWSLLAHNFEIIGLLAIGLSALMCIMLGFYFRVVLRGMSGTELPEDRVNANIDDGDSELGHFSPWSWWPILLAGALTVIFLGLAIGPWIAVIGVPLLFVAIAGWVFEYYRGYFAR